MRLAPLFLALTAASLLAEPSPAGKAWWSHIRYLADDKLEGRDAGSRGHKLAAQYVATEFEKSGLKPAGTQGYIQPVTFRSRSIVEEQSSLELIRDGKTKKVTLGEDATFGLGAEPDKFVEASAVFIGHGLQIPEMNIDDLAGVDLKGKIAVYLSGAPKRVPGPLAAHYQTTAERWKRLRNAGAIGIISMSDPKHRDIPWERAVLARFLPAMSLADQSLVDSAGQRIGIYFRAEHADMLFEGTGHTINEILEASRADQPLPKFPLKVTVRAKPAFNAHEVTSENVAAIVPGNDPKLKDEYVVLSAHLDHVGTGRPVNGDSIYNGAMDNASGIASLLEIGKRLMAEKKNKRSVLLVAVTGEEKGLLGSRFYADKPTVPGSRMVADLNLDMFLPIIPLKALTVFGLDESDLGPQFEKIASASGVRVVRDRFPERNLFIRSDQYNFIRHGIPALSFSFAADPGQPEDKKLTEWITNRYHAPSDDVNQPVEIESAVKFNDLLYTMTIETANRADRPQWNEKSFFRRFEKK